MFTPIRYAALAALAYLCLIPADAQRMTVSGSNVQDSTGAACVSCTITFAPVDSNGKPLSYKMGGAGGQVVTTPATAVVAAGVFSISLPDVSLTTPANVCFAVSVTDNTTGNSILGSGYSCVQPSSASYASTWCTTSTTCNFDLYAPFAPAFTPGASSTGFLFQGVWSSTVTYALGSVVLLSGTQYASLANGNINHNPSEDTTHWAPIASLGGATGPQGPQGIPGPSPVVDVTRPPYNAACDNSTDDTAALQAAAAAGPLYIPHGRICRAYNGIIDIAGQVGGAFLNSAPDVGGGGTINCTPTTAQLACVRIINANAVTVHLAGVIGNNNVTYAVLVTDTVAYPFNEGTQLFINNIGGTVNGVGIGTDVTTDVAHTKIWGTEFRSISGAGIVSGNGSQGNVLDNYCYGCNFDGIPVGVVINGGGMSLIGGASDSTPVLVRMSQIANQPLEIESIRTEGMSQLIDASAVAGNTEANSNTHVDNVIVTGGDCSNPVINWPWSGPIVITNSTFALACDATMVFGSDASSPTPVKMENVGISNAAFPAYLAALAVDSRVNLTSDGDYYIDPSSLHISRGSNTVYPAPYTQVQGAPIACASTITPTSSYFHITGSCTLNVMGQLPGMTGSAPARSGCLDFETDSSLVIAAGSAADTFATGVSATEPGKTYHACWSTADARWHLPGAVVPGGQTANTVLAGPATGSPAVPSYRSLVAADIPAGIGGSIVMAYLGGTALSSSVQQCNPIGSVTNFTCSANATAYGPLGVGLPANITVSNPVFTWYTDPGAGVTATVTLYTAPSVTAFYTSGATASTTYTCSIVGTGSGNGETCTIPTSTPLTLTAGMVAYWVTTASGGTTGAVVHWLAYKLAVTN